MKWVLPIFFPKCKHNKLLLVQYHAGAGVDFTCIHHECEHRCICCMLEAKKWGNYISAVAGRGSTCVMILSASFWAFCPEGTQKVTMHFVLPVEMYILCVGVQCFVASSSSVILHGKLVVWNCYSIGNKIWRIICCSIHVKARQLITKRSLWYTTHACHHSAILIFGGCKSTHNAWEKLLPLRVCENLCRFFLK